MHPKTGAAQMVVLHETVQTVVIPQYVVGESSVRRVRPSAVPLQLLAGATDEELLGYGVPEDWLDTIRLATEETVLDLVEELPEEAREAVLTLATGVRPAAAPVVAMALIEDQSSGKIETAAFAHPDAQRRFRSVTDAEELRAALDAPWEKWTVFLHPAQRALVERQYNGPARVTGSAGTGKTIVALHRAVHLAQTNASARVLLTTFSDVLAKALNNKLRVLIGSRPRLGEQIEVLAFEDLARRLYASNLEALQGPAKLAGRERVLTAIRGALALEPECTFSEWFLLSEWNQVVDAAQLRTWDSYRDHSRMGRRSRLREPQRMMVWKVMTRVVDRLKQDRTITAADMYTRLAQHYSTGSAPPYDFAVIDEAQDISMAELRCLGVLGGARPNALFFAGDTAQRIFQQPFSWKSMGVDVRGRSTNLKVNYRTSHQIRLAADRLLAKEVTDGDGTLEDRRGTVSVFNGPAPEIVKLANEEAEQAFVGEWLRARNKEGVRPEEMAIFVRSAAQLLRGEGAAQGSGMNFSRLADEMVITPGVLPVCTMHLAKGLEFRAVAVMACEEDVLPDAERLGAAGDASELEDVYNSERQILYVACTRARDRLLISSAGTLSEFLQDMRGD